MLLTLLFKKKIRLKKNFFLDFSLCYIGIFKYIMVPSQYQGKSYVICSSFTDPECSRGGHPGPRSGLDACLVHEML